MKRKDQVFGHRLIMTPLASYVGLAGMIYGAYALITGAASLLWILPMLFFTFWILMSVTVGFHRLFTHSAFETNTFWKFVLLYLGTLGIYGSSVQWSAMHASHHIHSDTPKDPHYSGWRYLFWKKNNPTTFHGKTLLRLYRDPMHQFFHKYYSLIVFGTAAALAAISLNALVFVYLIPMGWLHFVGSAHQVFAHDQNGPKDQGFLECVLFTGGEWCHGHHHNKQGDVRFGPLDAGYHVIRMIKSS
jgi:stearoyl-CoA desaturase (delta-9 desaturase)